MATNDQITGLVDVALQLKQFIENKDIEQTVKLFDPRVKINIYGRFYDLKTFVANLERLLSEIEQPGLDITSVDESDIGHEKAFIAFTIEIFWINQKTWEEILQAATLSLELIKEPQRKENWYISGFTLAKAKTVVEKEEVPLFPKDDGKSGGNSFLDSVFSFWY